MACIPRIVSISSGSWPRLTSWSDWRTADSPGAGLGLAIVRDLVTAHDGEVDLQTGVGQGTTVRCTLGPARP